MDKRLDVSRTEFEQRITDLRRGDPFMPPDPRTALDHDVEFLREQLKNYEEANEQYRSEIASAQKAAAATADEVSQLRAKLTNS